MKSGFFRNIAREQKDAEELRCSSLLVQAEFNAAIKNNQLNSAIQFALQIIYARNAISPYEKSGMDFALIADLFLDVSKLANLPPRFIPLFDFASRFFSGVNATSQEFLELFLPHVRTAEARYADDLVFAFLTLVNGNHKHKLLPDTDLKLKLMVGSYHRNLETMLRRNCAPISILNGDGSREAVNQAGPNNGFGRN